MYPMLSGFLTVSLFVLAPAAGQPLDAGARAAGVGGATTALAGDAWGGNPASWATVPNPLLAVFASQGYGLPALRLGAARLAHPFAFGTAVVGARSFGFPAYRETTVDAGFARALRLGSARRLLAGLRLSAHRVAVAGYGSAGAVGLSLGGLVDVTPALSFGFAAANVNAPAYRGGEELARTLAAGLAYRPAPEVRLLLDVSKDVRFAADVRAGAEVRPVPAVALRAGMGTAPVRFALGIGLALGGLEADLAGERHQLLGWTPALGLSLHW